MRNYLKYLKETRVFWILTLIVSAIFTIGLTYEGTDLFHGMNTIVDKEYVQLLMESGSNIPYCGIDASNLLQEDIFVPIIAVFIAIAAVIYFVIYRQKAGDNSFSRLPFPNGFERIYELITAGAVAVTDLVISLVYAFPRIRKYNKLFLDFYISDKTSVVRTTYEDSLNPKKSDVLMANIYNPKGFLDNLEVYICLGLIILCALAMIYLFGSVVKYSPVGYILGAFFSGYAWLTAGGISYFGKMSEEEYVNDITAIIGILLLILVISFVLAVRNEHSEKHKFFNYPLVIWLVLGGYVIYNNIETPIYKQIQFWIVELSYGVVTLPPLDFFLLAGLIVYLIIRKRKMVITQIPAMKHKGAFFEIIKPNIVFTAVATFVIAAIYTYQLSYMSLVGNEYGEEFASYFVMDFESAFAKIMAIYVIYKLGWFLLKKSSKESEKFDRFTVSKRKMFMIQSLAELVSIALPLLTAIGFLIPYGKSVFGNGQNTNLWGLSAVYLGFSMFIIASFAFVDYAYSKFIFKVTFLGMEAVICAGFVTVAECGFVIKGEYVGDMTEVLGIPATVGIILSAALILLVTNAFICKCDLSKSTFRNILSEPVYILSAVSAYTVMVIGCGYNTFQFVYGGVAGFLVFSVYIVYRILSSRKKLAA